MDHLLSREYPYVVILDLFRCATHVVEYKRCTYCTQLPSWSRSTLRSSSFVILKQFRMNEVHHESGLILGIVNRCITSYANDKDPYHISVRQSVRTALRGGFVFSRHPSFVIVANLSLSEYPPVNHEKSPEPLPAEL